MHQNHTVVPRPHPGPITVHQQVMAARHLMRRFSAPAPGCCFLCDDDNDLELAAEVGKAFLPSVTSVSTAGGGHRGATGVGGWGERRRCSQSQQARALRVGNNQHRDEERAYERVLP